MPSSKPTSMMVRNLEEAQQYAEFNPIALQIAEKFWPGPVTLVLPRKKALPEFFNEGHPTVGIRCPDSVIAQKLIEGVGRPLSTTSANVSGKPEAYDIEYFLNQYQDLSDQKILLEQMLILDAEKIQPNPPSTIVGFENKTPSMIRKGASFQEVEKFINRCYP